MRWTPVASWSGSAKTAPSEPWATHRLDFRHSTRVGTSLKELRQFMTQRQLQF